MVEAVNTVKQIDSGGNDLSFAGKIQMKTGQLHNYLIRDATNILYIEQR